MPVLRSLTVSRQGYGAMGLSSAYGRADDDASIATLHRALDLGISFFDTATAYGTGHNEALLGRALRGRREDPVIASKFTHHRPDRAGPPLRAREAVEASLRRLGRDHVALYYLHRVDPQIPVEDSVGELGRLQDEGKIGGVGVSEASAGQLRRAHAVHPLTALQSEYSLWTRDVEREILPTARELGIGFVAYSPLGRGFLAGSRIVDADDRRRAHPRFEPAAMAANGLRRDVLTRVAAQAGATIAQVSLAWLLGKGVVPIPGTRRIAHLEANWAANDLALAPESLHALEAAFTPGSTVGDRYPAEQMKLLPAA